ncbi:hypothetical protein F4859DRAFT_487227 [Xylaria cf. heliscus]|nr:hypothetical protein F4859DRAFT_487227 [Xylaria cf. heliscus]
MASDTNAFWGSSGSDAIRCHTPPTLGLLNNNPHGWDGFLDFKESIDPKTSLKLLQEPLPCTYEPHDDWLVEFKRLQDVHNRAAVVGVPTILVPPRHQQNVFAGSNASSCQPEMRPSYFSQPQCRPHDGFSRNGGSACVDKTNCTTSTLTTCSCPANVPCPGLYDWNPIPVHDSQRARIYYELQRAMKELREFEHNLQADTKLRISQVEQSHPG